MVIIKLLIRMNREIKANFGQFLSIVLIIAAGSMLMSGMFSSITAMDQATQAYYKNQNMSDLWIYFKGISEEEVRKLANTDGIDKLEGRYTISEQINIDGTDCTLRIHSLTDINRPLLTEGALPKGSNEILLDYKFAQANNFSIGSTIRVGENVLSISGFCMNPEYAYKQKDGAGAANSNRTFGIVYAEKNTLTGLILTSEEYIEQKAKIREEFDEAEAKLMDVEEKLAEGTLQYEENLEEADKSFEEAEIKLQDTKKKLDENQEKLSRQTETAKEQLDTTQLQIDAAKEQLYEAQMELDAGYKEYQGIRKSLSSEQQLVKDKQFQMQYEEMTNQQNKLTIQQETLNKKQEASDKQASEMQSQIDEARSEYAEKLQEMEQKKDETYQHLETVKAELDRNKVELSMQRTDFLNKKTEAEQELGKVVEAFQEVLIVTDHSEEVITAAKSIDSYVSAIEKNNQPSYVNVSGALDPIRSVSYIFPLIFFIVAAVIAFISLSKTVENQRTQIAVMQALGISKRNIRISYTAYALLTSVSGSILFAILGNILIPKLLIRVFISRFELPAITAPIYPEYVVLPLFLAVFFSGVAAQIAVQKVLREIPAQAMRPRLPKGSKTILLERFTALWKRLGYSNKLILRNLFLNKGRILLSSFGVIGSVMLIFTGLSLRSSAFSVIDSSIDSMSYDLSVTLQDQVAEKSAVHFGFNVSRFEKSKTDKAIIMLTEDVGINIQMVESQTSLVNVFDANGKKIDFHENSVIIPDSIAQSYGICLGDQIQVIVDDLEYSLTVTDISVQYTAKTMYLTFEGAKKAGMDTDTGTLLVLLADQEQLDGAVSALSDRGDIKSISTTTDIISRNKDMLNTLNATIMLILSAAAILAVTVIYNTTSINIFERTREYATLMVLGYYKSEVNHLTLVENMILTAFGCILGLPLGIVLFQYLAELISRSSLRIPSQLDFTMLAVTVILTFVFTLLSNLLLRPKIKHIVLTEALKSVE